MACGGKKNIFTQVCLPNKENFQRLGKASIRERELREIHVPAEGPIPKIIEDHKKGRTTKAAWRKDTQTPLGKKRA